MGVYLGKNKVGMVKKFSPTDRLQWKCDNIKSLAYEFNNFREATDISYILKVLDTSNVTNMSYMFQGCDFQTQLDLSSFDTSSVTNMQYMFDGCRRLETIIGFENFDFSNLSYIGAMFRSCEKLTEFDFSKKDLSKVSTMGYLFDGCRGLKTVIGLNMEKVTGTVYGQFQNCIELVNLDIKNLNATTTIGSGTTYGTKLSLESIINTFKEMWDNTGATSTKKLTMSTASKELIAEVYVKLVDITDEMLSNDPYIEKKKPFVVCESTDEGAMTLTEYAISKNWTIA